MIDLAITAVALVSPWIARVGEGAAHKLGEKAVEKLERLYGLIKTRLTADGESLTLLNLQQAPGDEGAKSAVAESLSRKMASDPKLAEEVRRLVTEAKNDPSVSQFLTQVYGGEVGKIVNIGSAGDVTIS
jgi:hypothetical protein